ncbi:putative potassium channel regulatory protein [Saccostrea echinata]|uniref:putative potassium channel regulatory protein n=1 Tax=Saccostrea echinata TaxID=191078 RepID=UPI002A7F4C38|nr:putative potassium channel regulatory protein [Saccostrea echinata]
MTSILQGVEAAQQQRLVLNVGGKKFETSSPSLQSDSDSFLAAIISKDAPVIPYSKDHLPVYFIDMKPRFFDFILDPSQLEHILPADKAILNQIFVETSYYRLEGLCTLIKKSQILMSKDSLWDN